MPLDQFISCQETSELEIKPLNAMLSKENYCDYNALEDPDTSLYFLITGPRPRSTPSTPKPNRQMKSTSQALKMLQERLSARKTVKQFGSNRTMIKTDINKLSTSKEPVYHNTSEYNVKKTLEGPSKPNKDERQGNCHRNGGSAQPQRISLKANKLIEKTFKPKASSRAPKTQQTFSNRKVRPNVELRIAKTDKKAIGMLYSAIREKPKGMKSIGLDGISHDSSHLMRPAIKGSVNIYQSKGKIRSGSLRNHSHLQSRMF